MSDCRFGVSPVNYPDPDPDINPSNSLQDIKILNHEIVTLTFTGERSGSVAECWTPEREVGGSKPTAAVLCP